MKFLNRTKKSFSEMSKVILMIVMCLSSSIPCYAQDFEYNGINYSVIDREARTCRTTPSPNMGPDSVFTIPPFVSDGVTEYTVIEIGRMSFYGSHGISKMTLPNTVKTIGALAFANCRYLATLNLPESLEEIGDSAFYITKDPDYERWPEPKIESTPVSIPDGVKKIGKCAFMRVLTYNTVLTPANIPASLAEIADSAFYDNEPVDMTMPIGLKKLGIMHSVIPGQKEKCASPIMLNISGKKPFSNPICHT